MTRISLAAAACALAYFVLGAGAFADPAGKTTLQETIAYPGGSKYAALKKGKGEPTVVRSELAKGKKGREKTRKTIAFFGQMTDPQVADEMSPARAELIDPAGNPFASGWRPQEALGLQGYDQLVRNVNANSTSPVKQGNGKRSKLGFVLNTGDMADSLQYNEAKWYIDLLEGKDIDPFTGKPIGPGNPCSQVDDKPAERDRLNADVAARKYTGIQDFDDWRGAPTDRYDDYWDPEEAGPSASGPYASFPRITGLMERAQRKFKAQGLKVPWYTARGNHDALWQGTFRPIPAATVLTTACFKPFPNDKFDPDRYADHPERIVADLSDPAFVSEQITKARLVPPDPDRRFLVPGEYKTLHGSKDNGHGFKFVDKKENTASKGAAPYYAFTKSGVRFIAIDTNAEGGSAEGNVDDPQYKWIEKELKAAKKNKLRVIGYSHHPLSSQNATVADEDAPACEAKPAAGCDLDPRKSTPIHRGLAGSKPMRDLFLKYPNFIAYVVGHIHENRIRPYKKGRTGFWEVSTASEIDWPQQARLIELMDNGDGTLSLFGTMIDQAAPVATPAGTDANVFTDVMLSSLYRRLSANDPQVGVVGTESKHAEGKKTDRNVELIVTDPLG